ncbi:hypothetical protein Taro_010539 [Colocasia esculenta]|uniref:Uncharacterized protein n=1 Tax=Colocasia esculenta TaxID=4460 RepID=A0A843U3W0_COLES|nr:hypothetical protein [Colocasia esculenta]
MLLLVRQRWPPARAAMGLPLRIILLCLAVEIAWADGGLFDTSALEMFVDDLPEMPKIRGYDLRRNGTPVSKSLTIGMFEKTWILDHEDNVMMRPLKIT